MKRRMSFPPKSQLTRNHRIQSFEYLEDRRLLTTYTVDTPLDVHAADGLTSLREAISAANANDGPDEIRFSPAVFSANSPIQLTGSQINITDSLTITGIIDRHNIAEVIIDGMGASRIFNVDDNKINEETESTSTIDVSISGLLLRNGSADWGGAIFSRERLTLDRMSFTANRATDGAAVWTDGELVLAGSWLGYNTATDQGGGIFVGGNHLGLSSASIVASHINNNSATSGGGIYSHGGLSISRGQIANNVASNGPGGGIYSSIEQSALHTPEVSVVGTSFSENQASGDGGAIYSDGDLSISDAQFSTNTAGADGGAIHANLPEYELFAANLSVGNTAITGNSANNGAGLFVDGAGRASVYDSFLRGNTAGADGGGVWLSAREANISRSSIHENTATNGAGAFLAATGADGVKFADASVHDNQAAQRGGGIWGGQDLQGLTVTDSMIHANSAGTDAGGIGIAGGVISTISNSVISENVTNDGGGIYLEGFGELTVTDTTVTGNRAIGDFAEGGGILIRHGTAVLNRMTVDNNSSDVIGGGILGGGDANVRLRSSTVSGNSAVENGGGIFSSGTLEIQASTVATNEAGSGRFGTESGAGVLAAPGTTVRIDSSIVADNTNQESLNAEDLSGAFSGENNLIGAGANLQGIINFQAGNKVGTTQSPIDAKLGPLADNGGPTMTHALSEDSPAINVGSDMGIDFDQRGELFPRIANHLPDIGAFELQDESEFFEIGLAFGVDTPTAFRTNGRHIWSVAGTTPAATVSPAVQEEVAERLTNIFADSGIRSVRFVGQELPGQSNIYFSNQLEHFPSLAGIAYEGIDHFNSRSDDNVAVFIRPNQSTEFIAEVAAHEVGHALGVKHVNPSAEDDPNNLAVMDYEFSTGDRERFVNAVSENTEPPRPGEAGNEIFLNPVYHIKRYVDGDSHEDLVAQDILPGDWDLQPGEGGNPTRVDFKVNFAGSDAMLHDVWILSGEAGFDEIQVPLAQFDSISLEELESMSWDVPIGSSIQFAGASGEGIGHDLFLVREQGSPFDDNNLGVAVTRGNAGEFTIQRVTGPDGTFDPFATGSAQGDLIDRIIGDSNDDGIFDSSDLVVVFQANEYEDDVERNSTFNEGDWNGDNEFDSSDLVAAFKAGTYVNAAAGRESYGLSADAVAAAFDTFDIRDSSDRKSKIRLI